MAASGIAEHNEARRKERTMQKIAHRKKALMDRLQEQFDDHPHLMGNSDGQRDTYVDEAHHTRKAGSAIVFPSDKKHDAAFVDQMRRNDLRQQQLCEYSAKIPHRFSVPQLLVLGIYATYVICRSKIRQSKCCGNPGLTYLYQISKYLSAEKR